MTLRPGARPDADSIATALATLENGDAPDLVHVVDSMPMTSWWRPSTPALEASGWPDDADLLWRPEEEEGALP